MAWERVYTINDFWDRPRLGIANVAGVPHIYQSPFDSAHDDFADHYLVRQVDPDLLELVLEDWAIWMRWSEAFDQGLASTESHPALPADRVRHDELQIRIGSRLSVDPAAGRKVWGQFRNIKRGWDGFEVEWRNEPPLD
ncbi:MAG: hypothetical protein K2X03_27080 [Bryobacteraceae bacterium]|nr:hypothetical protein [Bryobacteraceae bacterium]